ncbi:hypothetical protein NDU88_006767, partial [Pleurodeles waltl]
IFRELGAIIEEALVAGGTKLPVMGHQTREKHAKWIENTVFSWLYQLASTSNTV